MLPPLLTGSMLLFIANRSLGRVSEDMARAQVDEITAATETECRRYFERAVRLSNIMSDIARIGQVSITDIDAWKPRLFANKRAVPEVSAIIYISPTGAGTFLAGSGDEFEYGVGFPNAQGTLDVISYPAKLDGTLDTSRPRRFVHDLETRPWHQAAKASDQPVWTEPYQSTATTAFGGRGGLGVAYVRRIVAADGRPLGELAIVQRFSAVNEFLEARARHLDGYLLLHSEDGLILGTSLPHRTDEGDPKESPVGGREDPQRLVDLANDPHEVERALLPILQSPAGALRDPERLAKFVAEGRTFRARETKVRVREGSAWRLVVALPEPSLLGAARSAQSGMLAAGVSLVGLSALAGAVLATRLSRPLRGLARFASSIGAGGFEKRSDGSVNTTREMAELGSALDRMAEDLRQRVTLLAERDAAEQATAVKSRLIAHVSHEFRTPLNAIMNYAELLRDAANANDCQRDADDATHIMTAGRHLLSLIENLLDLSTIEAGRLRLETHPFPIAVLIDEVAATSRPIVERNRNRQHVVPPTPADARMTSDPTRVRQILINLVANAGKYTQDGDVTLRTEIDSAGGKVHFVVSDTGPGIPPDMLGRVFEPFIHVSNATTRGALQSEAGTRAGAGLGLAISRQLARTLGGDIDVKTSAAGTRMTLTLPLHAVTSPEAASTV